MDCSPTPPCPGRAARPHAAASPFPALSRRLLALAACCAAILPFATALRAQPPAAAPAAPGRIEGVVRSAAGAPAADAVVLLIELHRTANVAPADGSFAFADVPPGSYTLQVASDRAGSATVPLALAAGETRRVEVVVAVAAHEEEIVVSAGAEPRSALEIAQPVGVVTGEELANRAQASLGETLAEQPGVTSTYFGPGASRPVIRGLGGDRVRMLSSGIGTGDVSSTSPDHAVSSEPLSAESIEVLRGPATLLYGSSAIGGAVNVIDGRIPEAPTPAVGGHVEVRGGTVADERTAAAAVDGGAGRWAWHAEAVGRETGDYEIPGFAESAALRGQHDEEEPFGVLPNSDLESLDGSLGLSRFFGDGGDAGHVGISVSGMESQYGIPGGHGHAEEEEPGDGEDEEEEEEAPVRIDVSQRRVDLGGHLHRPFGIFETLQVRAGAVDYEHAELEGDEVGTTFAQDSWEARVDLVQARRGALTGALGFQAQSRDLSVVGEESFLPESSTDSWALFAFEELEKGDLRWQLGLRWEALEVTAADRPGQSYDGLSSSLGLVWLPDGGAWSLGTSLARAVKLPNVEELHSEGVHVATRSFQRGDSTLGEETSLGVDVTLRRVSGRVTGSLTVFATRFDGFIYERVTGEEQEGFPVLQFSQADARFRGAELETRIGLFEDAAAERHLDLELTADSVRAELVDLDQPLPRIPPWRAGAALHYTQGPWSGELEVRHSAEQDRLAPMETATDAYTLVHASVGYRLLLGDQVVDLTLRGRNLTDEEARPHTSFLKDLAPLPGRDLGLSARVTF